MFFMICHGGTRLPSVGIFYVQLNSLEDVANHCLFAKANLRKAYCKFATKDCELFHFWLHTLSFSDPTTVPAVEGTVMCIVHGSHLRAKVNEMFPIRGCRRNHCHSNQGLRTWNHTTPHG